MNWNFLCDDITDDDFLIDCRVKSEYEKASLEDAYYFPFIKRSVFSDDDSVKKIISSLDGILNLFEKSGKGSIVIFDEGIGMYAARMLYLLRSVGCENSYVYNEKWSGIKFQKCKGEKIFEFETKKTKLKLKGHIDKKVILDNLTKMQIFDTRTLDEYQGKLPRLVNPEKGQVCGRLPGALLWDWRTLYSSNGGLIDKRSFKEKLFTFPFISERNTMLYDYNGARSSLLALMLLEVGFLNVFVYQGSWYEWRHYNLPKQSYGVYKKEVTKTLPRVGGHQKI